MVLVANDYQIHIRHSSFTEVEGHYLGCDAVPQTARRCGRQPEAVLAQGCEREVGACSCASEWRSSISTSASFSRKSDRSYLEDFTGVFLNVFGVSQQVSVGMLLTHLVTA